MCTNTVTVKLQAIFQRNTIYPNDMHCINGVWFIQGTPAFEEANNLIVSTEGYVHCRTLPNGTYKEISKVLSEMKKKQTQDAKNEVTSHYFITVESNDSPWFRKLSQLAM